MMAPAATVQFAPFILTFPVLSDEDSSATLVFLR